MKTAGYSGTPLAKKLGIKEGFKIAVLNAPAYYFDLFTGMPEVTLVRDDKSAKDLIHYFVTEEKNLIKDILMLRKGIEQNGCIWISWPKKASGLRTDVTEDVVRKVALQNGLVDIKVCAVDDTWSGLKLVIPVRDRAK
jgi:hypothetical protein